MKVKQTTKKKLTLILLTVFLAASILVACFVALSSLPKVQSKLSADVYANLLADLQAQGYTFVLPFQNSSAPKQAVLIHDVDFSYLGAAVLADVEEAFGVRSAFFIRPDAPWFSESLFLFRQLETDGWTVGYQYDCLSRADDNMTLALELFTQQLTILRGYFTVSLTTYHGDTEYRTDINNYKLYDLNKETWQDLGLKEVYSQVARWSYISDTDCKLKVPAELGDVVLVQIHADWY